jgi:hypothetical protein
LPLSFWNLPPACSTVITTVAAAMPWVGWTSTGIPRPSSDTDIDPSPWIRTAMRVQYPPSASSMQLSMISQAQWW